MFLIDLFGVFGHYKAPWMGEMRLPVFRSCMCGCSCARIFIQSACSNLCHVKIKYLMACFSLLLTYISWSCVITLLLPGRSNSSDDRFFWCINLSLERMFCLIVFSNLELYYMLTSHCFFKHFVRYGRAPAIRNSLWDFRWYSFVCILSGHIIPWVEKANTAVTYAFSRPLSTSYAFYFQLHAKAFPVFENNRKLDLSCLKNLVGSWRTIFLLLWHLQLAEACKWRRKVYYVGKNRLAKNSQ